MALPFAAVTDDLASQLNFELLARLLGNGPANGLLGADANGNASWVTGALAASPQSGAHTAVSGEWVLMSGAHTNTLPAPTIAGQYVRVTSVNGTGAAACTVATPAGNIKGPGVAASATSILLGSVGATAGLQSDGTDWRIVDGEQDSGWLTYSFANSWGDAGTSAAYRLTRNEIQLRGSITGGTGDLPFATLPAGYRPPVLLNLNTGSSGFILSTIQVATSGTLTVYQSDYPTAPNLQLDNCSFKVD